MSSKSWIWIKLAWIFGGLDCTHDAELSVCEYKISNQTTVLMCYLRWIRKFNERSKLLFNSEPWKSTVKQLDLRLLVINPIKWLNLFNHGAPSCDMGNYLMTRLIDLRRKFFESSYNRRKKWWVGFSPSQFNFVMSSMEWGLNIRRSTIEWTAWLLLNVENLDSIFFESVLRWYWFTSSLGGWSH